MKYRLIVSDIDGTLTGDGAGVSKKNRQVLENITGNGVYFMIATGRSYLSAEGILQSLGLPCYVCLNNGAVLLSFPDKGLINTNYLSIEEKNFLVEKIQAIQGHIVMYSGFEREDKIYYTENYYLSPILKSMITQEVKRSFPVKDLIKDVDHPVPVISCAGTEEEIDRILNTLSVCQRDFNIIKLKDTYFPDTFWLMISRKEVDKVTGIQMIAHQLGITREEIIAIGDDLNDLQMIKFAGLGIAMENGREELKAVADLIAPSCDKDGLGRVLEEIFLKKNIVNM